MRQRIVQFETDEIIDDPEAVEAALNKAICRDGKHYWISGGCQAGSRVVFPLEEVTDNARYTYKVRELFGASAEDLIADIASHWQGHLSTRGVVNVPECLFGIFEKAEKA